MYRNAYGKQKKLTIAKTTQITPAQARDEAKRILALVVQGKDPASDKIEKRKEITVSDLARMFLADRKPRVKLNTYQRYCQSVEYQINPALGDRYVKELKRSDVQQFYNEMIEGKFMHRNYKRQAEHKYVSGANIMRKTLHAMFEFAIVGEIVAVNPCDRLQTLSTPKRTAFIDEKGYVKLGECLASCADKTAAETGYSDNIIAGMLGHSINSITHRYTHLSAKPVIQAANIVSEKIAELMGI